MDSVVSLAKSSSSKRSSGKVAGPCKQPKKKQAVSRVNQQQSQDPQGAGPSAETRPFQGKSPKTPAKPQGFAGKSRGHGRGHGRN